MKTLALEQAKTVGLNALVATMALLLASPIFVSAATQLVQRSQSQPAFEALAQISPQAGPSAVSSESESVPGVERLTVSLTELVSDVASNLPAQMSEEDQCLAQAVYFEARSETLEGQLAVAQVVLNRIVDSRFPETACGVVFQGEDKRHRCQFSFACDGLSDQPRNAQAWAIARAISHIAVNNYWHDVTSVSTHYHADYVTPYWGSVLEQQVQVGRHIFYRDNSF